MPMQNMLAEFRRDALEWEKGQADLAQRLAEWRAGPAVAPVLSAMEHFGRGDPLEKCAPLARLFADEQAAAMDFVQSFAEAGLGGLGRYPLGQLPLLHGTRQAAPALVLASSGRASLALAAYDGSVLASMPAPKTAKFVPRETWIHVLEGSGEAELVLLRGEGGGEERGVLQSGSLALRPGTVAYRYGRRQALQVRSADGSLVLLRLQRRFPCREPAREYSLPDGALVHQAAARAEDTLLELAVTLLGRMNRQDAVAPMVRIASGALDIEAGESLRWQAMREAIALDAAAGLDLLSVLATSPGDPLAQPAAALRASLLEVCPRLERNS
ncbi:hypothetical protein [Novosphingobium beihaiensis]|uniref:Uncharacterized protein n=1 Tax=Novosphingobium beihaiensis TaxID=2930389 RepID=A0ABT0BRX2_9SPHN|nr:hypothetical protein [Novosphingobium beihaiensis]MCJ2187718.1 hypothetical protein [Novosphingobium beihaiensis]